MNITLLEKYMDFDYGDLRRFNEIAQIGLGYFILNNQYQFGSWSDLMLFIEMVYLGNIESITFDCYCDYYLTQQDLLNAEPELDVPF